METSGVVYKVDCDDCLKRYTGETVRKSKKRMKVRMMEKNREKIKNPLSISLCGVM